MGVIPLRPRRRRQAPEVARQTLDVRPQVGIVALELDAEVTAWVDPRQARLLAVRLLRAADQAERLALQEAATCQPRGSIQPDEHPVFCTCDSCLNRRRRRPAGG